MLKISSDTVHVTHNALSKSILRMAEELNELEVWAIRNRDKESAENAHKAKMELLKMLDPS